MLEKKANMIQIRQRRASADASWNRRLFYFVVGRRHNRFIHVPIDLAVASRNQVAPDGDLWLSILEST